MDIDAVRAGSILVCPVKTTGGGVYMGDTHALQGDGEIAGHTCDVSGSVTLQVHLLKGLDVDGPILFPVKEDLPFLAKPLTADEEHIVQAVAKQWGLAELEASAPISVVGTGPDLNAATDNGLARTVALLGVTVPEIQNRATITGGIEIPAILVSYRSRSMRHWQNYKSLAFVSLCATCMVLSRACFGFDDVLIFSVNHNLFISMVNAMIFYK